MKRELSQGLHALLDGKLDTFEKLELVLAVRTAGQSVTVSDLAMELQVGRDVLRRVIADVIASGVLQAVDGDAVCLRHGSWEPQIAEAAGIYEADPTTLLKVLSRISMERIRSRAARTFADAFRIRGKAGD